MPASDYTLEVIAAGIAFALEKKRERRRIQRENPLSRGNAEKSVLPDRREPARGAKAVTFDWGAAELNQFREDLSPQENQGQINCGNRRPEPYTQRAGSDPSPFVSVRSILPESGLSGLERLHVGSLPSFGTLYDVELHGLAFLQALETTRVDCRVMHEDVLAVLTRDEAEALRIIEPLHGTLFHFP
jgi:hypothetical protein